MKVERDLQMRKKIVIYLCLWETTVTKPVNSWQQSKFSQLGLSQFSNGSLLVTQCCLQQLCREIEGPIIVVFDYKLPPHCNSTNGKVLFSQLNLISQFSMEKINRFYVVFDRKVRNQFAFIHEFKVEEIRSGFGHLWQRNEWLFFNGKVNRCENTPNIIQSEFLS